MSDQNVNRHSENAKFESTPGVRRRALTTDRVQSYALAMLGFPNVDVEIAPLQFQQAMERTLDEYNRWIPIQKYDVLTAVSSTRNQYNLATLNKPFGRGIVDVKIATKVQFFSPIAGIIPGVPHPITHLSPDQYDLALRYIFTAKKIYSAEPDWEWEEPVLWLTAPRSFGGPFIAAYAYSQDAFRPEDVAQEDWNWFIEYHFNVVKEMVGEARGKHGTIPGPNGNPIRGSEMVSEARDERRRLETQLETQSYCRTPPLGPGSIG